MAVATAHVVEIRNYVSAKDYVSGRLATENPVNGGALIRMSLVSIC